MDIKEFGRFFYGNLLQEIRGDRLISEMVEVQGEDLVLRGVPVALAGRQIKVAGVGKASIAMAEGLEALLGDQISSGLVIGKAGETSRLQRIQALTAAHPVPDETSLEAGAAMEAFASSCSSQDLVLFCLSGGASALMESLESPWTLHELQEETTRRLRSGETIHSINAFRKGTSRLKGGKLRRRFGGAEVVVLVMSDVEGNDLGTIGSGPLHDGSTPHIILADRFTVERKAVDLAKRLGYRAFPGPVPLDGEARERAKTFVDEGLNRLPEWSIGLGTGETTVTVKGSGRGGRAQEFAMAAAPLLAGHEGWALVAGSTDGTDGPTQIAGGVVDCNSLRQAGREFWDECMANNDSQRFLAACGGLIETGPTGCNLNDVALLFRGPTS